MELRACGAQKNFCVIFPSASSAGRGKDHTKIFLSAAGAKLDDVG